MPGISANKIAIPFRRNFSWLRYWATRLPYFALPATGVSLMVGQEVTIYGDSLINVPVGSDLTVTYTCNIGAASGNNYTITPVAGDVGDHSLRMVFVSNGVTRSDETITLSVYAEAVAGTKKVLMIGDSLVVQGCGYFHTQIDTVLNNCTLTFVGTQGTTTKHEGYGGFNWYSFTVAGSPFVKAGVIDIAAYFTDNSIDAPDYILINLGVNDMYGQSANDLTDLEMATIVGYSKQLIDAFLAYNANLKIIIGLPSICGNTATAWNIDYDESVYIQNKYIEIMHKFWGGLITQYDIYSGRVSINTETIFLDRTNGYNLVAGGGVHPNQLGYEQLGVGKALKLNSEINAFITTWNTELAGSATKTIVIPTTGAGYDCIINWGDGTIEHKTGTPGNITHVYATTGIKTVRINGLFPRIYFNNAGDKLKILTVAQWGNIAWSNMENAFYGCENLIGNYSDVPNTSAVGSFAYAFASCVKFNSPLNIDTGNGINFQAMLFGMTLFNQPLPFNMIKAENISYMFFNAIAFEQNISAWNVEAVISAAGMFTNVELSVANYDALLIGWAAQTVNSGVGFHGGSSKYSAGAAATARGVLTSAPNSWTITDGGQV